MPADSAFIPGTSSCRCTRCATDLSTLVAAARFCPCCGIRLEEKRDEAQSAFAHGIVWGYASAMFRLGAHHEFRHNDDEAFRCYGKACKLGNEGARAKLLDVPPANLASPES